MSALTSIGWSHKIADNAWSLLSRDAFVTVLRVISGALIARKLGPAAMGIWVVLLMIPSYAEAIARPKTDIAAVYFLGRDAYTTGELSLVLNVISVVSGSLAMLLVMWQAELVHGYLLKGMFISLSAVWLMALTIPVQFVYLNYSYLLLHHENIRAYNIMLVVREVGSFLLTLLALVAFGLTVEILVVVMLIAGVGSALYGIRAVHRVERMALSWRPGALRALLSYSVPVYFSGLVAHLNLYASSTLVAYYLIPSQVAFYRMAQDHAFLLNRLPSAIGTVLYPRIAKLGVENGGPSLAARSCRISLLLLVFGAAVGAVLIRPAVQLLYGPDYLALTVPFWILLPGMICLGASGVLTQYFLGTGHPSLLLALSIIQLGIQLAAAVLAISLYGIVGAAMSMSLAFGVTAAVTVRIFGRITGLPARSICLPTITDVRDVIGFTLERVRRFRVPLAWAASGR